MMSFGAPSRLVDYLARAWNFDRNDGEGFDKVRCVLTIC